MTTETEFSFVVEGLPAKVSFTIGDKEYEVDTTLRSITPELGFVSVSNYGEKSEAVVHFQSTTLIVAVEPATLGNVASSEIATLVASLLRENE